ncbi:MAG: hypothetical protein EB034_21605, partial [Verrucomicrobia bacterium]|nr:hypothetical protein [Verrucomicrobiota bacterium]
MKSSLLLALLIASSAVAAELPTGPLHAWYHDASLKADGPNVSAWESATTNGAAQNLTRVVGRPQVVRVSTATGPRTYPRALGEADLKSATAYLAAKWGAPAELPAAQQPQPLQLPNDPRVFRTTLRKAGDDGVHTYRIPGLATTPKGTLIAVFDLRHKHGGDLPADIDVGAMRSTDDGATWSPVRRILDFDASVPGSQGNGVGDPAILVDRNGTIYVAALWSKGPRAWNGSGPGMTPDETGQFVLTKSNDDGVTWSAPINITAQ